MRERTDAFSMKYGRPTVTGVRPRTKAETEALRRWQAQNPELEAEFQAISLSEHNDLEAHRDDWQMEATDKMRRRILVSLGIEEGLQDAIAKAKQTPGTKAVDQWRGSGKRWLVLSGGVGTGKTLAATKFLVEAGGLKVSAAKLVSPHFGDLEAERRRQLNSRHLLIDDLGVSLLADFAKSELMQVIDHRHESARRTIITTNLDRTAFLAFLGLRMADRISQDCQFTALKGLSMRRQNATTQAEPAQISTNGREPGAEG